MISTRSYYSPDIAVEYCRRTGQGLPLPLPQSSQSDHHSEGNDCLHRRLSPASEVDNRSSGGQTRRRIAVACQRCRKRKIKCSGDPGNGQGCSNCRSAGAAPSLCTFLRVNSRECETYLTVRGVQVGGRYTPYPSNQSLATRSSTFRVPSGNVATSPYANVPGGYDCYNGLYEPSAARSNYPGYPINYEDENYSGQSPAYMLPNNNDSMLSTNNIFGPPASPKTWDLFSSSTRTQHGFYSEQNPPSSGPLPSTTFSGHGLPFASHSNDVPASLSSNGTSMTGLDRILPDPTTGRIHQPAFMMGAGSSSDGLAMNSASYRNSIPWLGSDGMSASSQSSDRVMSISYGSTADGSGGSGESSASSQDTTFTYIPFSDGSPGTSMKAIVAATDLSKADCTRKSDDIGIDSRARTLSEESTPSPENNIAEGYGYSADMVVGRRSTRGSISSGMLSNGQEYTRLRPLPTPNPELYKSPQQDSADYHPQIEHRASIPSLSNSARY